MKKALSISVLLLVALLLASCDDSSRSSSSSSTTPTKVLVTAIKLNKTETNIYKTGDNNTETLSVSIVTPDNAQDKSVTWSSDNEEIATVNLTTGEVTAVAAGKANITATANDGSNVKASCAVTVTDISAYYAALTTGDESCHDIINFDAEGAPSRNNWVEEWNNSEIAKALAKAKSLETGNNCAVYYYYDWPRQKIYFAKSDGTIGNAPYYDNHSSKGLLNYNVYHIKK